MKAIVLILFAILSSQANAQIWPARTIPLHLAEQAVGAAREKYPKKKQSRYEFIDGYCEAFLDSWRHASFGGVVDRGPSRDPRGQGYKAGKAAQKDADDNMITPADFGYQLRELTGVYQGRFEHSEFVEASSGTRYHVNMGSVKSVPAGKLTVKAWVSPVSTLGYGHFNQWKQEIILQKVVKLEREKQTPNPSSQPTRDEVEASP